MPLRIPNTCRIVAPFASNQPELGGEMLRGQVVDVEPAVLGEPEDLGGDHGLADAVGRARRIGGQGDPVRRPRGPGPAPRSATMTAAVIPVNVPASISASSADWSASATDPERAPSGKSGNSPSA